LYASRRLLRNEGHSYRIGIRTFPYTHSHGYRDSHGYAHSHGYSHRYALADPDTNSRSGNARKYLNAIAGGYR
jgi:hypothetical protein